MSNICFIPARSSSTRLKDKNISPYKSGNLITHTIEQARMCSIFSRIILSSDDERILDMGTDYRIEKHLRDDKVDTIIEVLRNAIIDLDLDDEDTIGLLLVTCPLRSVDDIIQAYQLFLQNDKYHTVISVKKNENPIQMSFKIDGGGHLEPVMPVEFYKSTRKQDHEDTYFFNDAIIFDTAEAFMDKGRNLYGRMPIPYLMPWERSIAIDYDFQLKIAKCLGEGNEKF